MPTKAITAGIVLIAIALIGYFVTGMASLTALIPAVFGLPILISGLIARKPKLLKLGMHIAAFFGLLGFLAPLGRIIPQLLSGDFSLNIATASMIAMSLICLGFTMQCIQSFKAARRARSTN